MLFAVGLVLIAVDDADIQAAVEHIRCLFQSRLQRRASLFVCLFVYSIGYRKIKHNRKHARTTTDLRAAPVACREIDEPEVLRVHHAILKRLWAASKFYYDDDDDDKDTCRWDLRQIHEFVGELHLDPRVKCLAGVLSVKVVDAIVQEHSNRRIALCCIKVMRSRFVSFSTIIINK